MENSHIFNLPSIAMEKIFNYLDFQNLLNTRKTCSTWNEIINSYHFMKNIILKVNGSVKISGKPTLKFLNILFICDRYCITLTPELLEFLKIVGENVQKVSFKRLKSEDLVCMSGEHRQVFECFPSLKEIHFQCNFTVDLKQLPEHLEILTVDLIYPMKKNCNAIWNLKNLRAFHTNEIFEISACYPPDMPEVIEGYEFLSKVCSDELIELFKNIQIRGGIGFNKNVNLKQRKFECFDVVSLNGRGSSFSIESLDSIQHLLEKCKNARIIRFFFRDEGFFDHKIIQMDGVEIVYVTCYAWHHEFETCYECLNTIKKSFANLKELYFNQELRNDLLNEN